MKISFIKECCMSSNSTIDLRKQMTLIILESNLLESAEIEYQSVEQQQIIKILKQYTKKQQEAIYINPDKSEYYNSKGRMQHAYDLQAINKNPNLSEYFYNKAVTLRVMDRFDQSLEHYDLAIEKTQKFLIIILAKVEINHGYYIAIILFQKKFCLKIRQINVYDKALALEYFDFAIQKNPENATYYYHKSILKIAN